MMIYMMIMVVIMQANENQMASLLAVEDHRTRHKIIFAYKRRVQTVENITIAVWLQELQNSR